MEKFFLIVFILIIFLIIIGIFIYFTQFEEEKPSPSAKNEEVDELIENIQSMVEKEIPKRPEELDRWKN